MIHCHLNYSSQVLLLFYAVPFVINDVNSCSTWCKFGVIFENFNKIYEDEIAVKVCASVDIQES